MIKKINSGFTLLELILVAAIVGSLSIMAFFICMRSMADASASKSAELISAVADAKSSLCQISNSGTSLLLTNNDDSRWLLIAPLMQLYPASAKTNRFMLLKNIKGGRCTNFTIGDAATPPTIN